MLGSGESAGASFPYSPEGLATVAVAVGALVCVVWLSGCLAYCWWRHRHRQSMAGTVRSRDVFFLPSPTNDRANSGGVADSAHFSYSIHSLAAEPAFHHTSLESILSGDPDHEKEATTNTA